MTKEYVEERYNLLFELYGTPKTIDSYNAVIKPYLIKEGE